ncbi:MAG: glycosyltransferase family 4 protein, partial [Dehalococcoidia bacterium]
IASHELPPKDPRLLEAIEQEELAKEVLMRGPIPDEELPLLYNAAAVLAFPSRYEGFGFPPLEALACGTPVVCADAGGLHEVVGEAALLVPGDDAEGLTEALARVLTDPELRQKMRMRGLWQASRFSWETAARRTFEIYRQALKEHAIR